MTMTTDTDGLQRLLAELGGFETAMLVTHGASGELHARPMIISDIGDDGELWFVTNDDAPKVVEIEHDDRAVAIMQSSTTYVSLTGHIQTVVEAEAIAMHASARARKWLDPSHGAPTALVLRPLAAEIWDNSLDTGDRTAARSTEPVVEHVLIPFPPA